MSKRRFNERSGRSGLQANQESRGGRVLQAFRKVDRDSSELIGGGLLELIRSGDLPDLKTAYGHRAFVFDPRLTPKNVNPSLIAGYEIGKLVVRIQNTDKCSEEGYEVNLGQAALLPLNRRTIVVPVESEKLKAERREVYRILGESGIKGFTAQGTQKGRRIETPTIAIGNFTQPISKQDEPSLLSAIDEALGYQLSTSITDPPCVTLGELEIKSYKPN